MPEGPEIFLASLFINTVSKGRSYGGRVVKSEVSTKNPDVEWDCEKYHISAVARGKELKVTLTEGGVDKKNAKWIDILFRFGMSGSFKFTSVADLPKHAHLRFFTNNGDTKPMVLSFVDYRRFGRWEVGADWSPERGPDPMWEYESFRENIMSNLSSAAFNKPICETMLNQKFFNGIGNYLRAEILYRCGVRPFDQSRDVLEELKPFSQWYTNKSQRSGECKVKVEDNQVTNNQNNKDIPDILDLCHIVPKEVINLEGGGKGYNVDLDADEEEYAAFREWLQCYNQDGMKNLVDSNKRTIWFSGEPGKLVPKGSSSRRGGDKKRKNDAVDEAKSTSKKKTASIKKEDQPKKKQAKTKDKVAVQKPKISNSKKTQQKAKVQKNNSENGNIKTESNENGNIKTETKPRKNPKLKVTTQTPLRRSSRRMSSQSNGSV